MASRIVIVRLRSNTGASVSAVSVLGATPNRACRRFPVNGFLCDTRLDELVTAAVAGVVVVVWGPGTLRGHDNTRRGAR